MKNMQAPVSPGEVMDKITILEIKLERMTDPEKIANVKNELSLLQETWTGYVHEDKVLADLRAQLRTLNEALWEIEDDIREKERAKEFDEGFIALARNVYLTNDRRSMVKREINLHLGSEVIEEKSYRDYSS